MFSFNFQFITFKSSKLICLIFSVTLILYLKKLINENENVFQAIWNIVTGWVKKNGKYRAQRAKHVVLFHLPGKRSSS